MRKYEKQRERSKKKLKSRYDFYLGVELDADEKKPPVKPALLKKPLLALLSL